MQDLISRQAAIEIVDRYNKSHMILKGKPMLGAASIVIELEELPSAEVEPVKHGRWIPIKMRPMDSEEREYWQCQCGFEFKDEDAVMFDCPMPEDGQEILVSYRKSISMDKCEIDGGCYGLKGNGDWEWVIAWMPLPEPYKEGEPHEQN